MRPVTKRASPEEQRREVQQGAQQRDRVNEHNLDVSDDHAREEDGASGLCDRRRRTVRNPEMSAHDSLTRK